MEIIGFLAFILFVAAQGGVVFVTAYLALRLLKASHWLPKLAAMAISYLAWIALTVVGYSLLGGDFGLMDGMGALLMLCFTAAISSMFYLFAWVWREPAPSADEK